MEAELHSALELIPGKFYLSALRSLPQNTATLTFFCIDNELIYEPFYADFGPLNLGCVYQYVQIVKEHLANPGNAKKKVVHYCSMDGQKRSNSAVLAGAYLILEMGMTAEEAWKPLKGAYLQFRDASYGVCMFTISVLDCLKALESARNLKWIDFSNFDVKEYQFYEKVENGDLNVIIPGKFVAFSGPSATRQEIAEDIYTLCPEDYTGIFRKKGVTAIVRLNKKVYDRRQFTDNGFRHYEMYFVDGGTPTEAIIRKFMEVCESEGAVAVHCKAGLGRTGTLIGLYMMKHYRLTAVEVIAYLRLARPGSVIGPQQLFLKEYESRMWKAGELYKKRMAASEGFDAGESAAQQVTASLSSLDIVGSNQPNKSPPPLRSSVRSRSSDRGTLSQSTSAISTSSVAAGVRTSALGVRSSLSALSSKDRSPSDRTPNPALSIQSPFKTPPPSLPKSSPSATSAGSNRLASLLGRSAERPSRYENSDSSNVRSLPQKSDTTADSPDQKYSPSRVPTAGRRSSNSPYTTSALRTPSATTSTRYNRA